MAAVVVIAFFLIGAVACGFSVTGSTDDTGAASPSEGGASSSSSSSSSTSSSSSSSGDSGNEGSPSSACGDILSSPTNCGACNHNCLGGACANGMCQPTVFADNEPDVHGIAVLSNAKLVWARQQAGIIRSKPLDGSAAAALEFDPFDYPTDVATDPSGAIYYTSREDGSINRHNANGTGWSIGGYTTPTGVSVDGNTVYFTTQNANTVESASTSAGSLQVRASGLNYPADVSVVDGKIYVASNSGILLANSPSPPHTIISPTSRFLDGGTGDVLHTGLIVDGATIYFTIGEKGIVAKVPTSGGSPAIVLASGQQDPRGIAFTADAIYWANRAAGTIMKLAK